MPESQSRSKDATVTGVPVSLRDPEDALASQPAPTRAAAAEPGAEAQRPRMGRYEVLEELAHGGMGAVFKVRDPELGRTLALKVLLDRHQERPDLKRRFLEEAQIGGQLQHPGLVPVHELGQLEDQRPFFTMKLVKGQTLAEQLRDRKTPTENLPRFLTIFEQACQALAYAHSRGVIHRDLKPSNVMVGAFGEVQVMDWGLAKLLGKETAPPSCGQAGASTVFSSRVATEDESATQAGTVLGTPAYMAPEQARGQVDHLDERCDVFGLGAMLCEILTGQPLYQGTSEQIIRQAAQGDQADARGRLEGCGADAELVQLALRCLAFQPLERPAHAGAVAEAITAYRSGVEQRLRQAEVASAAAQARAAEERKRRKVTLALALAVLLLVVLGGGGWLWITQEQAERDRQALLDKEKRDRETRAKREGATRLLQKVLVRAEDQRGKARAGNDAARWAEARTLAEQAETLLASVPAEKELSERVRVLRRELQDEEKDRQLLVRLEQLWRDPVLAEYSHILEEHGFRIREMTAAEAAAWVRRRPAQTRERLLAGLDAWFLLTPAKAPDRGRLLAVLQAADENGPRKELRAAVAANDQKTVERLASPEAVQREGPETVLLLARYLRTRSRNRAIALLRTAQQRFPGDFWITYSLAYALVDKNHLELADAAQYEEVVRFDTAALALRPDNINVLSSLGVSLACRGRFAEGTAALERAIARQPNHVPAYVYLSQALRIQGQGARAEEAVRRALQLRPNDPLASHEFGQVCWDQGRYDEAAAAMRRGTRGVAPAQGHLVFAGILWRKGRQDEGTAELRKALRLQADFAAAKLFLQLSLHMSANRFTDAENLCRTVVAFQPKNPYGHLALYIVRVSEGRFADALPAIKRCAELSSQTPSIGTFPSLWERETEQLLALEPQLPEFLQGKRKPRDAAERDLLLYLCWAKKKYAGAARLYAEAFAADPKLADNLLAEHRCDAARQAARAAVGLGDGGKLTEQERTRLRKQAMAWLRADLAARTTQLQATEPGERADARARLRWWQQDPALAGLRAPGALRDLSTEEQEVCRQFWADVAALLK